MVVPHENSVVVSSLWLKGQSRAEDWEGLHRLSPSKSRDAEVISITASTSGPDMQYMIKNEKNLFLFVYHV